ncbi:MAG: hypothetical protein BWY79_01190 [Actinobacteria bacterium ADurb.Bin444]|nr:MAG: hypothetical protein BWY79_01190 [Actinobacteria bacterium ADurb.Bin444]
MLFIAPLIRLRNQDYRAKYARHLLPPFLLVDAHCNKIAQIVFLYPPPRMSETVHGHEKVSTCGHEKSPRLTAVRL